MSDSSTPDALMLRPVPLTSVRERDGRPYTRFADVEEEIAKVLQSDRSGAMLLEAPSRWKTQTLVYFAEQCKGRQTVSRQQPKMRPRWAHRPNPKHLDRARCTRNARGFGDRRFSFG